GRVASAGGPKAGRGGAGDVGAHRRAAATKQTAPRRRNPKGAWVLRAIAALLLLDDPHRDRLRRRALRSPHNTHARDRLYFHHGLLARASLRTRVVALARDDASRRRAPLPLRREAHLEAAEAAVAPP